MGRKKKLINNSGIPQHEIEHIARCILPDILAYYESEEGQREFREWLAQREAGQTEGKAGKRKKETAQGAASLAAPFLMQKMLPLTHFGGEKAADSKASWTRFLFGNTITFECPKQAFYMHEFPKSVRLSFRVVLERMKD